MTTRRVRACALTACAAVSTLALVAGCSANTSGQITASPTKSKKHSTTPSSTPSPTYTRRTTSPTSTPSPSATKTTIPSPEFVASLPSTVNASVGQKIIVQVPTEVGQELSASASGAVTISGPKFNAPPEDQPDAPGTTIATITVQKAGKAVVTFTSKTGKTQKLTIQSK